jgi:folate-binding Fe-S cluster repair protein YgfZ
MLLSSMESLFKKKGYNITLLFLYYNYFNDISWKTTQQIEDQLYTDLMGYKIFKMVLFKNMENLIILTILLLNILKKLLKNGKEWLKNLEKKKYVKKYWI